MARYDVFVNPTGQGYVLDVQADVLDTLNTRIVVPMIPIEAAPTPARRLNPIFEIESADDVLVHSVSGGRTLCAPAKSGR